MFIYAAQPLEFFPHLLQDLLKQAEKSYYEFTYVLKHTNDTEVYPLYMSDSGFLSLNDSLKNSIKLNSFGFLDLNSFCPSVDIVVGTFDPDQIKKDSANILTTIVGHPVDRIYDMYSLVKSLFNGTTCLVHKIDPEIFKILFGKADVLPTLEEYVDFIISKRGNISNGDFSLNNHHIRQFKKLDNIDQVFTTSEKSFSKAIDFFNKKLNINLKAEDYRKYIDNPTLEYRRKELEDILEEDIKIYNQIENLI
jgi:hypothetical protein